MLKKSNEQILLLIRNILAIQKILFFISLSLHKTQGRATLTVGGGYSPQIFPRHKNFGLIVSNLGCQNVSKDALEGSSLQFSKIHRRMRQKQSKICCQFAELSPFRYPIFFISIYFIEHFGEFCTGPKCFERIKEQSKYSKCVQVSYLKQSRLERIKMCEYFQSNI